MSENKSGVTADFTQEDGVIENILKKEDEIIAEIIEVKKNVATKINRTDTRTFFIEPSKWVGNAYVLDISNTGWTSNSILQLNANQPQSNQELAFGIKILTQSPTLLVLTCEKVPEEPVIVTFVYVGEETTKYIIEEELGTKEIIWYEKRWNTDFQFLLNAEGAGEERYADKSYYQSTSIKIDSSVQIEEGLFGNCYVVPKDKELLPQSFSKIALNFSVDNVNTLNITSFCNVYIESSDILYFSVLNGQLRNYRKYGDSYTYYEKFKQNIKVGNNTLFICSVSGNVYSTVYMYLNGVLIATTGGLLRGYFSHLFKVGENTTVRVDEIVAKNSWNNGEQANYVHELTDIPYKTFDMIEHKEAIEITEKTFLKEENGKMYKWNKNADVWEVITNE